jgi:hypothetical protein
MTPEEASNAQVLGSNQRWDWDKTKPAPPAHDGARVRATPTPLSSSHPNSVDSIMKDWRQRLVQSRAEERVRYHRKNLFSRQTFMDGTAEMKAIMHDYPYDPLGLTPSSSIDADNYRPS